MGIGVCSKRVNFILILIMFLSLTTFAIFFQGNQIYDNLYEDTFKDNQFNDIFNDQTLNTANNDPTGKPLLVKQRANISRTFTNVGSNQNVTFPIVPGWISKNTTVYYEGVERQKQWVTNDHFDTNADNWNYVEEDTYSSIWPAGHVNWLVDGHLGSVRFGIAPTSLAKGDYAGYQQTFTISEETMTDKLAIASFDYYYDLEGSYPDASIYLKVTIGGVEKNITRHLDDISMNQWETISMQYNAKSIGQILPGSISVFAGLYINDDSSLSMQDEIFMDNIKLSLWTNLNNTPGLIRTYDVLSDTDYQYYNLSEGQGYSFIDIERSIPGDITFTIFENISPEMDYIEFNIREVTVFSSSLKTFNTTYFGKEGSFYTLGSPVYWMTSFSITLPTYYYSWIEILKPVDWSITSIFDGFETEQIGECYGKEYGSSTLIIPYSIIGEGIWDIKAESQNNIIDIDLMVWNQTQFENQLKLTQNDILRVDLALNGTLSLQNSELNCTIFYPNRTIVLRESLEPSSYNVNFGNYSVGKNMTVGQYLVEVIWRNDKSSLGIDQVGFANLTFSLWHHTNLTAITSYYELIAGEPLLLKVSYIDIDLNIDIDIANVKFSSSYGLSGTMAYQGLGLYFVDLDTSSLGLGNYFFSFNATKSYYENQTKVDLIQLKIVAQPLALDFASRIINSTGNSYALCKVNVIGEMTEFPEWPVNISSDWDNGYSIFDYENGTYTLNFSTYGLPTEGILDTYEIEIFANKTNYESTSDFITLIVHPITTLAMANNTNIHTYINEDFELRVNYTVKNTGALISGAECTVIWEVNYEVSQDSDGFIIKYSTSGLNIDLYNSLVRLSKPGYEDALISITVIINEKEVSLTVMIDSDEIIQNELVELFFNENVNITSRVFSDREEKFLTGGVITILSDNFQGNLTEFQSSYYSSIIIIDGEYFNPGLNTLYLRFERQNYTTEIFSFQFFIRAQNVLIDVEINNQIIPENFLVETSYNDLIAISCRAFAEYEGIYLSDGIVKFMLDNYEFNLTEYSNYWYNGTVSISTDQFSLGINYVYVKFELSNYTTTAFSFQIFVNQIELDIQPIDFTDSLNVYSGEDISIRINLTENGSTIPIANATVYCYWEFGTYFFEYIGDGLYQLDLGLPTNIIGTHRFNLIISTNGTIYKTTEHSFLIIVSEIELPDYFYWIIFLSLIVIVGILGSLSLRSYVILPRKRKRELIIADKAQPYKDIRNIQAVLVSHRTSGISVYNRTFSILDENYISGFSGFIQAITILGKQYTKNGVKTVDVESNASDIDEEEKDIKELDFNFFHSLICDFANVRVVLLLRERSSERLRRKIDILTREISSQCIDLLTNFKGSLTEITSNVDEVLSRHLPLYYKDQFVLNKTKHYHSVKVSGMLSNIEIRMLNALESQSEFKNRFLLEDLIKFFKNIDEDEKIIGVESLIEHKMIIPGIKEINQ